MLGNKLQLLKRTAEYLTNCKFHCSLSSILTRINSNYSRQSSCESVCLDSYQPSSVDINPFREKLEDPGVATYFAQIEPPKSIVDKYDQECYKYLQVTISAVKKCLLGEPKLNLKDYRLGNLGAYILFEILVGPPVVPLKFLDVSNCPLFEIGCSMLSDLMQQSLHLEHLIMSNCRIGSAVGLLSDGIQLSQSITYLNFSRCRLKDEDGAIIVKAMSGNEKCKSLDLSYNILQSLTGKELGKMFAQNSVLEKINLKWNDLFPEKTCSVPIIRGLRKNKALQELDLSWNGLFGKRFAKYFRQTLAKHNTLRILNLESNYFDKNGLKNICAGIQKSKSLREIYLGRNFWDENDLFELMKSIEKNKFLRIVSFGEFTILPDNVCQLVEKFKKTKRNLKIIFQGKLLPNPPDPVDFRSIIIDRAKYSAMAPKKKKMKRDFGHFMQNLLTMDNQYIKRGEFEVLLKKFNARLSDDLVIHLIEEFTVKVPIGKRNKLRKRVDIKGMAEYYLNRHPTEIPAPIEKKSKKTRRKKNT